MATSSTTDRSGRRRRRAPVSAGRRDRLQARSTRVAAAVKANYLLSIRAR